MPKQLIDVSDIDNPKVLATIYDDLRVEGGEEEVGWIRPQINMFRSVYNNDLARIWEHLEQSFNNGYIALVEMK